MDTPLNALLGKHTGGLVAREILAQFELYGIKRSRAIWHMSRRKTWEFGPLASNQTPYKTVILAKIVKNSRWLVVVPWAVAEPFAKVAEAFDGLPSVWVVNSRGEVTV